MLGPLNCDAGLEERRGPLLLPLLLAPSSGAPDMPLAAAAMAAMFVTGVWLMLFLRVTRCAGWRLAADMDCEWVRFLGSEPAMVLDECRCWLAGRTLMGSWIGGSRSVQVLREQWQREAVEVGTLCTVMLGPPPKKVASSLVFALFVRLRQQGRAIVAPCPKCRGYNGRCG